MGLAAAIAAALWISLIAGGELGVGIGLALASMATLFLSIFMAARRTKILTPAAIVGALWLSVIGVGLISSAAGPALRDGGDDVIDAVLAPLGVGDQGQDGAAGAVLGLAASGGEQSREFGGGQGATNLLTGGQPGPCAPQRRPRRKVLTIGILFSPWSGGVVSSYPSRACGPESRRVAIARVRASSPGDGLYAASGDAPGAAQGGSPGAAQGGSPGNTVGNAGNTVGNAGNTAGNTVGNAGNTVGNTGNTVGNTVNQTVGGAGNILKGLGG
ncbi:MAG: hypothetical protein ACXWZK_12045 [Solirubrobacterales bacterium]